MRADAIRYKGNDPARSHNSDEIARMLQAQHNLCFCLSDAKVAYLEVMQSLVFNERIDWYEQHVREFIRGTKKIFYDALFPEWETEKASILQRGDQYALMLESLPDYDDVPLDASTYDDAWSFVNSQTLGFTHPS